MERIVNVKFKCCGMRFDAAIDCDWCLHAYSESEEQRKKITPIELYNIDKPEWDVIVVYQHNRNDQSDMYGHTVVDWENLIKETRRWVKVMKK